MQLCEMEDRLGTRLVERSRARVIVTPVGQEIARRGREILAGVEDIREIARREDPSALPARLHLGVEQTIGAYVLSVAMPEIRRGFPHMRLFVREDRGDALLCQLAEGMHDAILLPDEPAAPGLVSRRLLSEPLHIVLPADHPLARTDRIVPADLAGETILTMESAPHLRERIMRFCKENGAFHARDYEGTTLDTLRQMVAAGMGISLLPALYIRSEVMREQLVTARPPEGGTLRRPVSLVWRRETPRGQICAAPADSLSENLSPWDAGA